MDKINIGIIGCGGRGRLYSRLLQGIPQAHLYGYSDIKESSARACLEEFGGEFYTTEVDEIFENPNIDAVIISTWHDTHTEYAIKGANSRKHILIEKPLALTIEECERIGEAVEKNGVKLMVCFKMRFMPMVQKVKEMLCRPILLVGQMMDARWSDDTWSQKPEIGGGNVISQGCHTADLLYYLAGAEPEVVYAEGGAITHPNSGIIDNIVGTIRFKNGVIASIIQGDGGLNNFTSKFFIEVFAGEKGATLYNRCHDVMFWGIEPQHLQAETYSEDSRIDPEGDLHLLKAFISYILEDNSSVPRWQDGRRATALINKLFESIRTRSPQKL